jgi:hypothetical protein
MNTHVTTEEPVSKQRIGKHTTIGVLLETVFSIQSVSKLTFVTSGSCVEAWPNTSTVTLRVVGGDEKESLKSETVEYGRESHGTRTRE